MSMAVSEFLIGSVVSLLTSWLLVTRLERIGERFGFTEGLLGVLAALAADAPEITGSSDFSGGFDSRAIIVR